LWILLLLVINGSCGAIVPERGANIGYFFLRLMRFPERGREGVESLNVQNFKGLKVLPAGKTMKNSG
jgi:hypothetical protein